MDKNNIIELSNDSNIVARTSKPFKHKDVIFERDVIRGISFSIIDIKTMNKVELTDIFTIIQLKRALEDYIEYHSEIK